MMIFKIDVIKFRDEVLKFSLFQNLFDEILSLVPSPWFIEFTKVFNKETSMFDTLFIDASGPFTFSVDPE